MRDLFLCVDGNSLLHRAFHALPLMDADGVYTNAVHGFLSMLLKVIKDYEPRYAAVAFDLHTPTFRHLRYEGYKAGRKSTPDELRPQFPLIQEILRSMHIGVLTAEGFEADDILGTVARHCQQSDALRAMLLTGDKDALQLVDDEVQLLFTRKGISETTLFTPPMVKEVYGITPRQVPDWKGLMGDSSDNIPGIPGVGEKTAVKLLQEYGTLENVLDNGENIKGKLGEKVRSFREQALFSKDLATIRPTAPIAFDMKEYELNRMQEALPLLRKYQLGQISQRLEQLTGQSAPVPEHTVPDLPLIPFEEVSDGSALQAFLDEIRENDVCALHVGETEITLHTHTRAVSLTLSQDLLTPGLSAEETLELLKPMLARAQLVVHDGKRLMHILARQHIAPPRILSDTMLGAYLLNPQEKSYSLSAFGEDSARGVWHLWHKQQPALKESGMEDLLNDVEIPLSYVLFDMEQEGFRVDEHVLRTLGDTWQQKTDGLKKEIYDLCGMQFNINSPQQLGKVLFETLQLPHGKKTARGYSTDADTLENIRDAHPVVGKILEYRQVVKLHSTYVDALLEKMDHQGRIHSFFDQTGTSTGRISSSEPNLQNIPVRTDMGREIRRAFIPREGWVLFDADYSQIELRILAHLSEDAAMMDAFLRNQDVHTRTASEVFDVPMADVTSDMRRSAKAVNFGLVYGISEFGLARNIGVTRKEAGAFIARYFSRYPGIKKFMDDAVKQGYETGCARTVMGRRRMLPELKSSNQNVRAFGERAAMNTPVQGTAADIIKLSMVRVHQALKRQNLQAKLILQVHDELIIECPPEEKAQVETLLHECMENAVTMRVPLSIEAKCGESWYETK